MTIGVGSSQRKLLRDIGLQNYASKCVGLGILHVLTDCLVVEVSQLRAHGQQVWVTASNHQHNCSGRPTRYSKRGLDGQTSNHSSPRPVCLDEVQQS